VVRQPSLFIGGAADPSLEPAEIRGIYDRLDTYLPGLQKKVLLPDVGHAAAEESVDQVNELLLIYRAAGVAEALNRQRGLLSNRTKVLLSRDCNGIICGWSAFNSVHGPFICEQLRLAQRTANLRKQPASLWQNRDPLMTCRSRIGENNEDNQNIHVGG
jgi:hypothetical protein